MRRLILLLLLASAQDPPGAKVLEEALRPPPLAKIEISMWPYLRPLTELTSKETLALLEKPAERPEALGLKTPVERAMFQGLLWSFFDAQVRSWTWVDPKTIDRPDREGYPPRPVQPKPEKELAAAVRLMKKIALDDTEIKALPNPFVRTIESRTYPATFDPERPAAPFLPADLDQADGPWVSLGNVRDVPLAQRHVRYFGGRSSFHIYFRAPGGRAATLALVERLKDYGGDRVLEAPELPAGLQVALIERTFLVTPVGKLVPSPLVESAEFRVHLQPKKRFLGYESDATMVVHRFRLRHDLLLSNDPAPLRARQTGEDDWEPVFQLVENGRAGPWTSRGSSLVHCHSCHSFPQAQALGIFELRSLSQTGPLGSLPLEQETARILAWKEKDFTWKELQALWR
jgi:hypothetical protein